MAEERKVARLFPFWFKVVDFFYPRYTVEGLENLPDAPTMIIGNHAQIHGPLCVQFSLPDNIFTWCAAEVRDMKEAQPYAYRDFWSGKPRNVRWLFKLISYAVAPLLVYIHKNARTIGVYHDHRVMTTFRETIARLEEGRPIVVFPEKAEKNNAILCRFQEGFVDTAKLYHRRTGKKLNFVPMYVAPSLKKIVLGKPVEYNENLPMEEERSRICEEMTAAITQMALSLPRHTVTPYLNVSKKEYPQNIL